MPFDVVKGSGIIARFKSQNNGGDQAIQVSNGVNLIHIGSDVDVGSNKYWPYIWVGGGANPMGLAIRAPTTYFTGNVGIGNNDPQYTLDVNGNMRAAQVTSTGTVSGATVSATDADGFIGPKFTDSNDGSYYVDPNSQSIVKYFKVAVDGAFDSSSYAVFRNGVTFQTGTVDFQFGTTQFRLPRADSPPGGLCVSGREGFVYYDADGGYPCICGTLGSNLAWRRLTDGALTGCS